MKIIVVFLLTFAAIHARDIYTYFDLIYSEVDWRPCCNTTFLSRRAISKGKMNLYICSSRTPDDINCIANCFFNSEELLYDYTLKGFNVLAIKRRMGSAAYLENDWKTENADQIIDDCLAELPQQVNSEVIECNPNVRTFENCYWNKLFQLCPADIKNETNCLY